MTQFARFAAATLLPFMVSKLKKGRASKRSTSFNVFSGMTFALKPLTSSMKAAGLFIIFCAAFQSIFFFSFFSKKPQAAQTSTHSPGGLPKPLSSPIEFLSRQFTASPAASMAGRASLSSPSASDCSAAALLAKAVVFASSSSATAFSCAAMAEALDTWSMSTAVAAFFSPTCTMVIFRSSFRPSTLCCTCSMMARPRSKRSQFDATAFCLSINIFM
mmetsp:Transcript_60253/g.196972  ORF Transcript_60253/g.196972 Transcript_60253/m.196972 type:complete len:217 (-) Transcript_60253:3491-4141(-)